MFCITRRITSLKGWTCIELKWEVRGGRNHSAAPGDLHSSFYIQNSSFQLQNSSFKKKFIIFIANFRSHETVSASRAWAWPRVRWDQICIKNDESCINNDESCIKNDESCIKNDEYCIKNDEFCIKHDESCIKNDESCIKVDEPCIKNEMNLALKMIRIWPKESSPNPRRITRGHIRPRQRCSHVLQIA